MYLGIRKSKRNSVMADCLLLLWRGVFHMKVEFIRPCSSADYFASPEYPRWNVAVHISLQIRLAPSRVMLRHLA